MADSMTKSVSLKIRSIIHGSASMFRRMVIVGIVAATANTISSADSNDDVTPIDPNATQETRNLLQHLHEMSGHHILFGHHDTTWSGVGWQNQEGRSDVKTSTGHYPAIYGWDLLSPGPDNIARLAIEAYGRGGINELSWHLKYNGSYNKSADNEDVVKTMLPGGAQHQWLTDQLDMCAAFIDGLKDLNGVHVPIIFRPWHENTGKWFWWGTDTTTPDEYIALWRFTISYLNDVKGVHNIIWAYAPSRTGVGSAGQSYDTNRFPGYPYVDVLGLDFYYESVADSSILVNDCRSIVTLCDQHNKVPALAEFGWSGGTPFCPIANWWTTDFLGPLKADDQARRITWAMTWLNTSNQSWIPLPGDPTFDDFVTFSRDPTISFGDMIPNLYSENAEPVTPAVPTVSGSAPTTPTLSGTTEPGATVRVYDNGTLIIAVTADGGGNWSIALPTLNPGSHALTVTSSDAAGNTSGPSPAVTVTVPVPMDTTPPATPAAPMVAAGTTATPTLSGTTEAGATLRVYDGGTLIATTTADGSGNWSITLPTLNPGSHALTVTSSDAVGNTSGVSPVVTVTGPSDGAPTATPPASSHGGGGGASCGNGAAVAALLLASLAAGLRQSLVRRRFLERYAD